MNFWSRILRDRRNQELDEEIRAHLAMASRVRMERGETSDAASSAAHREFGNPTDIQAHAKCGDGIHSKRGCRTSATLCA
jgi:hypothetical protein